MTSGVKLSDKKIIKALEKNAGIITAAAESLGMDRCSLSRRINGSEKLRAACDEIAESMVDLAESKLLLAIRNGHMTAIIFYLKTKGKARGYIERYEKHDMTEAELNAEIEKQLAHLADTSEAAASGKAEGNKQR